MPNLVGIGNTQVPTNAMLGGLAYQDSVGEIDIDKIKARIGDNAVDIFVYDTRKDSDGGAWRKKATTQSWYDEGASALRGARKEFPAVAVLVLQSLKLTIYDGDDPNLPMWMVVTGANNNYAIETAATCTAALNGVVCIGCGGSGHDFYYVNFLQDAAYEMSTGGDKRFIDNIATRSSHTRESQDGGRRLISRKINDVAMTVLPGAPIDDSTGLPVPTIAVATDSGTSIIKDNGTTVVDIVYSSSPATKYVNFRESDNAIVMSMDSNASYVHVIYDIPGADISGSHQYQKEGIDDEFYRTGSSQDWNQEVWITGASPFGSSVRIANNVISGNRGINVLSPNKSNDTMVAWIRSSHNSGYMHGDNRGAWLSDTDDTNLSGGEIITGNESNFSSSGVGNWTGGANSGSPTVSNNSNRLYVDSNGSSYPRVQLNVGTQPAGTYTISGKYYYSGGVPVIVTGTGAGSYILDQWGGDDVAKLQEGTGAQRDFSRTFTIASSFNTIGFRMNVAGGTHIMHFDDLQLIRAEYDRSQKNKHLRAFGTINKNPVATGAELVSYNFPAAASYFTMPYDTNIVHVGSGNFSVMGWFYNTPRGVTFFDIASAASPRFFVAQMYNSDTFWFYMNTGSGGVSWNNGSGIELETFWQFLACKRVGTTFSYSLNGKDFISHKDNAWGGSISGGSPFITLGQNYTHSSSHFGTTGEMALWRFSHSDISIDQVKKIYNDEKKLFGKNAKCTLYGTSNAVTGLAFDNSSDILHVGTSAGRSDFRGLARINNTTTAVTTAISASNEFVAEQ